jgi:hypothetical protein
MVSSRFGYKITPTTTIVVRKGTMHESIPSCKDEDEENEKWDGFEKRHCAYDFKNH